MLLSVNDLSVAFPTPKGLVRPVDGVSFEIGEREIVGLVGESGSGKSLTGLSLMRIAPPNAQLGGSVLWNGEDVFKMSPSRLRRLRGGEAAMVFQDPFTSLNPLMTVGEQVSETIRLHQGLSRAQAKQRAIEMLAEARIPSPETTYRRYPHQLSGGQRQRAMIAIAFACQPKLLIADEPTTALDATLQVQILELILALQRSHGTATLLISHDLGVIGAVCERMMVMYSGRIVETGDTKEVLANPRHPYTQALLDSLPGGEKRPTPIPDQPPDPASRPPGCAFHPRCSRAFDRCRVERPDLIGSAACWLRQE
ncbi:MAG: ABC transporter ATP-binding protein [Armatimonadetes bacterium]|nr:ABC transporter ATP-binding protein [Armatimonadota bacterium]